MCVYVDRGDKKRECLLKGSWLASLPPASLEVACVDIAVRMQKIILPLMPGLLWEAPTTCIAHTTSVGS